MHHEVRCDQQRIYEPLDGIATQTLNPKPSTPSVRRSRRNKAISVVYQQKEMSWDCCSVARALQQRRLDAWKGEKEKATARRPLPTAHRQGTCASGQPCGRMSGHTAYLRLLQCWATLERS